MKEVTITELEAQQRFDRFLRKHFKHTPEVGLWDIFSRIRTWSIKVNGKKKKQNYRLQEGDIVTLDTAVKTDKSASYVSKPKKEKVHDLPLEALQQLILFEDEHWIVRNKPPHLLMHPWDKHLTDITLTDMMMQYLEKTDQLQQSSTFTPSFCYRLDKDTSWIVISAKTYDWLQYLNKAIRERNVHKTYRTILVGDLQYAPWFSSKKRVVHCRKPLFVWYNKSLWRSQTFVNWEKWKESHSEFHLKKTYKHPKLWILSDVVVTLHTWRMHQIRAHAAHLWHPVLWDIQYGWQAVNRLAKKHEKIVRQLLHAVSYWFFDPFSDKDFSFSAPIPIEMRYIVWN